MGKLVELERGVSTSLFFLLACHHLTVQKNPVVTPALRLTAGSCNNQDSPQDHWPYLSLLEPDYFVALGDNVYADHRVVDDNGVHYESSLEHIQEAYQKQLSHPEFQDFVSKVPIIPTWDDHDYGLNDAGADLSFASESQKAFLDFWKVPQSDERRERSGIYMAQYLKLGSRVVQVLVLDTRRFRSPLLSLETPSQAPYGKDSDPLKTVLGKEQWEWFEEELKNPADLRVVVSSIQVLSEDHHFERWGTFPLERKRILNLMAPLGPVLLLSGDRHMGAIYHDPAYANIWELTSSSLNFAFGDFPDTDPFRVGDYTSDANYALIDIYEEKVVFSVALFTGNIVSSGQIKLMPED